MVRRRAGRLVDLEFDILTTGMRLQAEAGSFYGFSLARRLVEESESSALTAHGTLYKALRRLNDGGLLDAVWEDPSVAEEEGRPRRRLYVVNAAGVLAQEAEEVVREGEVTAAEQSREPVEE
ncbi:MAG: helix-turn-helix transcriptional regulator [Leifsonia flava]